MKYRFLYIIVLFLINNLIYSQDLKNPLFLDNEWPGYAIGDPYVLKHNGVFYLYCSTKDSETGIKCWSSKNLVNWSYEGLCSTDPKSKAAFAPEVVYWNGIFYMYTSPAGNGHYVLSGSSPTGPFTVVSTNLGKSIDGSVFIDDDASWKFYHASPQGIMGCSMSTPVSIGPDINLNAKIYNNWTEGPCVFKRYGKYYMIYTGNHVISKGYRIDYATNSTGPLDAFTPAVLQNPILLDALGLHVGLGHGSIFVGPDLDSYYLTYHNLVSGNGPFRRLNFDRIAWNGDKMVLLGPTVFAQHNPELPDAYDYFNRAVTGDGWIMPEGGRWSINDSEFLVQDTTIINVPNWFMAILDSTAQTNYTAEFNIKETKRENESATLGAVFGFTDNENYGIALLNSFSNQLEINFIQNNTWGTPKLIDMPSGTDYSKLHCIRIEKFNDQYKFFVDGLFKLTTANGLGAGKIGYLTNWCHGDFGFIAYSNMVHGTGTFDVYKPVPGKLPAMQYNSGGEGTGFHKETPSVQTENILRTDEVELVESSLGGYALASVGPNEWFNYKVNVELQRMYNNEIIYSTDQSNCKVRFLLDGTDVSGVVDLPSTGSNSTWGSFVVKDLNLTIGYHTLKVEVISGVFHLYSMEFVVADNQAFDKTVSFDGTFGTGWKYDDGNWQILNNSAFIDGFGKRTYGSDAWRDYTVETDIQFTRSMNAGLIFRVTNPALGGAGDSPSAGTDYLQGYFVGFNYNTVVLGKHNYGWQSLTTSSGDFSFDTWYHLRVVVLEGRIRVYLNDMNNPVIDYTDPFPFLSGMAGYRSYNTGVKFDNFHVTSDLLITSERENSNLKTYPQILIFPNPGSDYVTVTFDKKANRVIRIFDLRGAALITEISDKVKISFPVDHLNPGMYFIRVDDGSETQIKKLILN